MNRLEEAPPQGTEGAPDAWIEMMPAFLQGLEGLQAGQEVILLTWLHLAKRDVLRVHPRGDDTKPLRGVFATRSPSRPNPIGLHRVVIYEMRPDGWLRVGPLEVIDGTSILDIKPV